MKDHDIEAKIDDLAHMVSDGFTEVRSEIKELHEEMTTKDDSRNAAEGAVLSKARGIRGMP